MITVQLPKVEDSRSFVITPNLRNLKDLQDAIVLEDPSVQSINAVSHEGTLGDSRRCVDFFKWGLFFY